MQPVDVVSVQVFENTHPWQSDVSLVKIAVGLTDDDVVECLPVRQLHHYVTVSQHTPVGSVVTRVQLQQLPCLSRVCTHALALQLIELWPREH